MRILVGDTSNSSCCAGVYELNENLEIKELSYRLSLEKRTHSEVFLPLISEVMNESSSNQNDIDYYAITVGPGSFTGIRIGVSTIKGMSVITGKDTVAISSTDALARSFDVISNDSKTFVLACFDARNKRVFASVYDYNLNPVVEENAYAISDVIDGMFEVIPADSKVIVCGNGADAVKSYVDQLENKTVIFDYAPGAVITPIGIAKSAAVKIKNGEITSALKLAPKYCAKSQAERFKKPIEVVCREADISEATTINVLEAEGIEHPWTFEAIKDLITDDKKVALVATDKNTNEVLGYIGASFVLDEAEIGNLCVFGKFRRIGVATKIMVAFKELMISKGIKTVFLEVNHDNYQAIFLYEKAGFVKYGSRKDYYGQGKDADLYKFDL